MQENPKDSITRHKSQNHRADKTGITRAPTSIDSVFDAREFLDIRLVRVRRVHRKYNNFVTVGRIDL